jgi:hypothetical protein
MERLAERGSATTVHLAVQELGLLIDTIDQTTDLLERSRLFRRLRVAAETLGVLRAGFATATYR